MNICITPLRLKATPTYADIITPRLALPPFTPASDYITFREASPPRIYAGAIILRHRDYRLLAAGLLIATIISSLLSRRHSHASSSSRRPPRRLAIAAAITLFAAISASELTLWLCI